MIHESPPPGTWDHRSAAAPPAPDATALVSATAELAAAAAAQIGPEELLARLVGVAAGHLAVDDVGVMVVDAGAVRFVHADVGVVDHVERLQQTLQEGPCRDATLFSVEVVVDDLADPVQTAWPEYVAQVLAAGFRSVVAVPLVSRGRVWGSLDLYRRAVGTWQQHELEWVRLLAHVAVSYLVMAADREEARRAQRELAHRSTHDALTGLPNRALLLDRLEHALQTARRHRRVVAVLFIDLDRFKAVNDTFGHAAGDTVLTTAAARMAATLREGDTLARLAGDEFVLVCEDLPQAAAGELREHVAAVATRLRRALAEPVRLVGADVVVAASIGVALSDEHPDADELLADADAAMYRAKQSGAAGRGDLAVAGPHDRAHRSVRQLERQLGRALPLGQLRVHYQPILEPGGAVYAVEALLRWQHPEHGLLPAAEFVDLAAGSGLVVGIGRWVLTEACAQMARWQGELGPRAPQVVYVNVSARELADPALTGTITTALRRYGLPPERLGLELLESSFLDADVLPSLHEQQRRGHPLSIDDFGTGYSSLSRLVELPVRMAKVDRGFVAGVDSDPRRRALVDAVVTVARSLDLRVVAEGVETPAQADRVTEAGCHYLQGFHCGRPQPAEDLTAAWAA
ncbi:putative bifunctional diguanylate cyclase/phosphodiesterase [Kineococcus glutinatus]|uniref:Diguanylate cyclase (GGDEF)-like protein n=1 Tax=Kineococcus glutinatus TaxID=1070872 RepID=A0ABP9I113_9ACTN